MKKFHVELGMGHTAEVNAEWFESVAGELRFSVADDEFVDGGRLVAVFRRWESVITLDE